MSPRKRLSFRLTRRLQIGFLVLLGVSTAQLAWWMVDQVMRTAKVRARLEAEYRADATAAEDLLKDGGSWSAIHRIYPHLVIADDSATVLVAPSALAKLNDERFHRLNQYAWEGGFFLLVLVGAMAVVYRALHAETQLRRRQESFLAGVSHELKSPLASLRLSAETIALRDPPAAQRADLVQRLLSDLTRLERMIGNILDVSRLSAGNARTAPGPLALADEVADAVTELRDHASENGVTLTTDIPPHATIQADREAARTVLRNLLHNAIRASQRGGQVTVTGEVRDDQVRLTVRDEGVGFPPEEARRLFEKFYRVDTNGRGRPGGTGLGLYLVRRCVELDGGTVTAESPGPNRGAVFTVTWMAAREDA